MPTRPLSHSERLRPAKQQLARQAYEQTTRCHDPALALAKRIRNSQRWRTVRAIKLARNPLCENPEGRHGPLVVATEVDHVQGLRIAPALAYDLNNLMALCTKCHSIKSMRERAAYGH